MSPMSRPRPDRQGPFPHTAQILLPAHAPPATHTSLLWDTFRSYQFPWHSPCSFHLILHYGGEINTPTYPAYDPHPYSSPRALEATTILVCQPLHGISAKVMGLYRFRTGLPRGSWYHFGVMVFGGLYRGAPIYENCLGKLAMHLCAIANVFKVVECPTA